MLRLIAYPSPTPIDQIVRDQGGHDFCSDLDTFDEVKDSPFTNIAYEAGWILASELGKLGRVAAKKVFFVSHFLLRYFILFLLFHLHYTPIQKIKATELYYAQRQFETQQGSSTTKETIQTIHPNAVGTVLISDLVPKQNRRDFFEPMTPYSYIGGFSLCFAFSIFLSVLYLTLSNSFFRTLSRNLTNQENCSYPPIKMGQHVISMASLPRMILQRVLYISTHLLEVSLSFSFSYLNWWVWKYLCPIFFKFSFLSQQIWQEYDMQFFLVLYSAPIFFGLQVLNHSERFLFLYLPLVIPKLVASYQRGTCHLFPFNREGGRCNTQTHPPRKRCFFLYFLFFLMIFPVIHLSTIVNTLRLQFCLNPKIFNIENCPSSKHSLSKRGII